MNPNSTSAFIVASALIILLVVLSIASGATRQEPEICTDSETRDKMRALALEGIDDGFRKHMMLLFDVWVKDIVDQPKRAITGNQLNMRAYLRARAEALRWNPPECP